MKDVNPSHIDDDAIVAGVIAMGSVSQPFDSRCARAQGIRLGR